MKFTAILLNLALILSVFAGCQNTTETTETTETVSESVLEMANPDSLIEASEVDSYIGKEGVVIIGYTEKNKDTIPGSVWLDRNLVVHEVDGDLMSIQSPEVHAQVLSDLGVKNSDTIIIYDEGKDSYGFGTRFLWQLRAIGHEDVKIVNGGTTAYKANGGTLEDEATLVLEKSEYVAVDNIDEMRADIDEVVNATNNEDFVIIDIRTPDERDDGYIEGSIFLEYPNDILNDDGSYLTTDQYAEIFKDVDPSKEIITYCLGGIRAAQLAYILTDFLGYTDVENYDGSWWEYGISGCPIVKD